MSGAVPTVRREGRRIRSGGRVTTSIIAVAVSLVVGACSLPLSDSVDVLSAEDYPEMFEPITTSTSTTAPPDEDTIDVGLFFVADGQLEKVTRTFLRPFRVPEALQALVEAPTDDEAAQFENRILTTELLDGLDPRPLDFNPTTGVYPILLDPAVDFRQLSIDDDERASLIASQITCTITGLNLEVETAPDPIEVTGILLFDSSGADAEPISITDSFATPIEGPIEPRHFDDCRTGTELRAEEASTSSTAEGQDAGGPTTTEP